MTDSFAQWMYERYGRPATVDEVWEDLDPFDQDYWEHEAAAVRRAVARRSKVVKIQLEPEDEEVKLTPKVTWAGVHRHDLNPACREIEISGVLRGVCLFRESPGKNEWPELMGVDSVGAEIIVKIERPDVQVDVLPVGAVVFMNYREDRVRVYYDPETRKVDQAPHAG